MRREAGPGTVSGVPESELDDDLPAAPAASPALLAGFGASADDIEPWQRLGDLLGHVTGEAETG